MNHKSKHLKKFIRDFYFPSPSWENLPDGFPNCNTKDLSKEERYIFDAIKFVWVTSRPKTSDSLEALLYSSNFANALIHSRFTRFSLTAISTIILMFGLVSFTYFINVKFNLGLSILSDIFAQTNESSQQDFNLSVRTDVGEINFTSENKNIPAVENPKFNLEKHYSDGLNGIGQRTAKLGDNIKGIFGKDPNHEVKIEAIYKTGSETLYSQTINYESVPKEIEISNDNLKPGAYTLSATDIKTGTSIKQDFTWGVLAINTDKPVYKTGQTVEISMAVLDDQGKMLCDAKVVLKITLPDESVKTLTTENNSVSVTPECRTTEVTLVPDYRASITVESEGKYLLDLTAETKNGTRTISSQYTVDNNRDFYLKRVSATRVYPRNEYPMLIEVEVNKDFKGLVSDSAPKVFTIDSINNNALLNSYSLKFDIEDGNSNFRVSEIDNAKKISWDVDWKAGNTYYLAYEYQGPLKSPEFYTLGQLLFDNQNIENRIWQIAWDSAGDLLLFLDPAQSTPSGWSDVTSTYTGKFIRGAATAGGSGGNATHTHTYSGSSVSTYSADQPRLNSGSSDASPAHTHAIGTVTGLSASNDPQYNKLKVIRYSGIPTTIPQYAIAMFDASISDSDWTRYSTQDNYFIYADSTAGTGGNASNQHYHTITVSLAADASAAVKSGLESTYVTSQFHNHDASSGYNTNTTTNTPPYRDVYLYYVNNAAGTTKLTGMIGMFDASAPSGWDSKSGSGGDFENKFLRGANTYGSGGGGAHQTTNDLTGITSGAPSAVKYAGTGTVTLCSWPHTHTISLTGFSAPTEAQMLPQYNDVVIAKYNPSSITVSGNAYSNEGTTVWSGCDSSTARISLVINGGTASTTSCDTSTGYYSFGSVSVAAGNPVSVFFNTAGSNTDKGVAVTVANDATSNITLNPRKDRVWVKSETGVTSITNSNLDHCDKNSPADCSNVPYGVTSSNLTVDANYELHVESGKTHDPGGTVSLTSGTGDLHVAGNSYLDSSSNSIADDILIDSTGTLYVDANTTVNGGDVTVTTTGVINRSAGTGKLTMVGGGTVGGGSGNITLYDLESSTSGTTILSGSGTNSIIHDLTAGTGTTIQINNDVTIDGNFNNTTTGKISYSGTPNVTMYASSSTLGTGSGDISLYGLTISYGVGTFVTFSGSGVNTFANNIVVDTDCTLSINSNVTIAGSLLNFGNISHTGNPTITMSGTSKNLGTSIGNLVIHALNITGSITFSSTGVTRSVDTDVTVATGGAFYINDSITIAGNLTNTTTGIIGTTTGSPTVTFTGATPTIGGGSGAITFFNLATSGTGTTTISSAITTNNNLSIGANTTLALNAGVSVGNNYSNSGTLTANSQKITMKGQDAGNTLSGTMTGSSSFYDLEFDDSGTSGAWTFGANSATVTRDFTITGGAVTAPASGYTLTIGRNFTNNDSFINNSGTVAFNTTNTSTLSYSATTTFNNFTVQTAGKHMQFDDTEGIVTDIDGELILQGTDCSTNRVFLTRDSSGTNWDIAAADVSPTIEYVDVGYSNASPALTAQNSTADNDNNSGWTVNTGTCGGGGAVQPNVRGNTRIKGGVNVR